MKRRTVLRACGVAGAVGLAGCGGATDDGNGGNGNDADSDAGADVDGGGDSSDGGGDGDVTTTPEPPAMGTPSLTAGESECLSGDEEASVTFGEGVDIEGTISAPNPCHAPKIDGASYDLETDTLSLTVTVVDDSEEGTVCASCVGGLEYSASVPFRNGLPGAVTVTHDGIEKRVVADVRR